MNRERIGGFARLWIGVLFIVWGLTMIVPIAIPGALLGVGLLIGGILMLAGQ